MKTYQIEKNIPMPNRYLLPFDLLEVGDSFIIPADDIHRVRSHYMRKYNKLGVKRFITKQITIDSFRVWRMK